MKQNLDLIADKKLKVYEAVIHNNGANDAFVDLFDSYNLKAPIVTGVDHYTLTEETPAVAFNASSRGYATYKGFVYRIAGDRVVFTNQSAPNDSVLYQGAGIIDDIAVDDKNRLFTVSSATDLIEIININTGAVISSFSAGAGEAPQFIEVDLDRNQYYVYLRAANELRIYDLNSNAVKSTTALNPIGVIIDMALAGSSIFVISQSELLKFDVVSRTNQLIAFLVGLDVFNDIQFLPLFNLLGVAVGGTATESRFYTPSGTLVKTINFPDPALRIVENPDNKEIAVLTQSAIQPQFFSISEESYQNNTFDFQLALNPLFNIEMFAYLNSKYTVAGNGVYVYLARQSNIEIEKFDCYVNFNAGKQANRLVIFEFGVRANSVEQLVQDIIVPNTYSSGLSSDRVIKPIVQLNQHSYRNDIVKIPFGRRKVVFDLKMKFKKYRIRAGERVAFEFFYKEFKQIEIINYDTAEKFVVSKDI